MTGVGLRRTTVPDRLRALRQRGHTTQVGFARALGWPQSRVSKIETGAQLPTDTDVRAWCAAAGATDTELEHLLALVDQTRLEYTSSRHAAATESGLSGLQDELGVIEARAERVAEYQPAMLPGLLQTPAYARELLTLPTGGPTAKGSTADDVERMIAGRVRRQNLLYEPGRRVELIIGEAALYSRPGSREVMVDQLDRLVSFAGLSSLELGVIAFDTPMPVMGLSGFSLLNHDLVYVETLVGRQQLLDEQDVVIYLQVFERLSDEAARGRDVLDLIRTAQSRVRD